MTEPMLCCGGASASQSGYCANCDLLVGLHGLHVLAVDGGDGLTLRVTVESAPGPMGCPGCGVVARGGVAEAVRADVTDELDVERLFSEAVDSCGGIDAVVQAVIGGLSSSRTLSEVGLEEFTTLTRGGARASFLVNREAARHNCVKAVPS